MYSMTKEFSAKQSMILWLLHQGRTNAEIARMIESSIKSVEANINIIYRKIDVLNRVQAAVWFERNGSAK